MELQVVGLGLTTIDIVIRLEKMPTWEGHSSLSELKLGGGGPVGTALVAAARLGLKTGYVGTCGNDEIAGLKLHYLECDGVDTSRVVQRPYPESQVVLVYVHETTGERVFSAAWEWHGNPLKPVELDRQYITSADILHLDHTHPEAALQAARWMHAAGKKVMLDAYSAPDDQIKDLVRVTDILICGDNFGPDLASKADIREAGEALLALGPQVVVQTAGAGGSYTTTRDEHFHTPAFPVDAVDTTGAGDVFHGAYLVGLVKGWDPHRTALFASAVAAIKCTRLGGRQGIPFFAEVMAFLAERDIAFLKGL